MCPRRGLQPVERAVEDGIETAELQHNVDPILEPLVPTLVHDELVDPRGPRQWRRCRVQRVEEPRDLAGKRRHQLVVELFSTDARYVSMACNRIRELRRWRGEEFDAWKPDLRWDSLRDEL